MTETESESLKLAKQFIGKEVEVIFDRPLGSKHPKHDFVYEVNYGYIDDVKAPDGENLDAYFLGINEPVQKATGVVKAIVHRLNDDDDKLVVMPNDVSMTDAEIDMAVGFQEKWFTHRIIR